MQIPVNLGKSSYDIILEHDLLVRSGMLLNLKRNVLIVTDDGVPALYAETVAKKCRNPVLVTVNQGEGSKSFATLEFLCAKMLQAGFTRSDCVVAVGGGVIGDLAGFAAASYMRGIDFYNIPTTLLSQVDSSIGGKVAINFKGVKNIIGAFWQPKRVLIDPEVLKTLPQRQVSNGLAEAIKMSFTCDKELFSVFEEQNIMEQLDCIIEKSLRIKKSIVQQDEKEQNLRRVLNFGHTLGHGIESEEGLGGLYHGECVALGMLPMCESAIKSRLINVLNKAGLPTTWNGDMERVCDAMAHDKKRSGDQIAIVFVKEIGSFELKKMTLDEIKARAQGVFGK